MLQLVKKNEHNSFKLLVIKVLTGQLIHSYDLFGAIRYVYNMYSRGKQFTCLCLCATYKILIIKGLRLVT